MDEEQNGVSLGDIFRTIFVQKWLAFIIAVVITVGGTLGIYLIGNNFKRYYDMQFSLVLPGNNTEAVYTYPDGTTTHYSDFISYASLTRAAEESGINVDVSRLINSGDITIARNVTENEGINYTITAKADYFANYECARQFLAEVAYLPVKALSEMILNYDVYLTLSSQAEDYETQIELLISQLDNLVEEYSTLIGTYGGLVVADGKTLNAHYNELKAYSDRGTLNVLLTRVKSEGIIKSEESKAAYESKQEELNREYNMAKFTLDNLLKSAGTSGEGGTVVVDGSVIKEQSDLVAKLEQEKKDIERYISSGTVDAAFEDKSIKPEYERIKAFTDELNKVVVEVYDKSASVSFLKANVISTEGGTSLIMSVLISLVIGVVVALIAGYIAGKVTLDRRKRGQTEPATEPENKDETEPSAEPDELK